MNDRPTPESKPILKRIDGPPKPPTETTLDLMDGDEPPPEDNPVLEIVRAITHATTTWGELFILNGGGRYEKRERLELSLDRNVILLGKFMPKTEDEEEFLQIARDALRNIRDYRRRFPRRDASNREQAAQAQRILAEVPDGA